TASGSAGIYTGIEPYTDVIRHLHNGLLVPPEDNTSRSAWRDAIEYLYQDSESRERIVSEATRDVEARYETEVLYGEVHDLLSSLLVDSAFRRIESVKSPQTESTTGPVHSMKASFLPPGSR